MRFTIHPELAASNVARARAWYSKILGVEPVTANGEPVGPDDPIEPGSELLYDTGSARFGVYESRFAGSNQATAARLVVSDFDAAFAELTSKGVVFEEYDFGEDFRTVDGVLTSPDGERTCWFKDSEGNILALGSST